MTHLIYDQRGGTKLLISLAKEYHVVCAIKVWWVSKTKCLISLAKNPQLDFPSLEKQMATYKQMENCGIATNFYTSQAARKIMRTYAMQNHPDRTQAVSAVSQAVCASEESNKITDLLRLHGVHWISKLCYDLRLIPAENIRTCLAVPVVLIVGILLHVCNRPKEATQDLQDDIGSSAASGESAQSGSKTVSSRRSRGSQHSMACLLVIMTCRLCTGHVINGGDATRLVAINAYTVHTPGLVPPCAPSGICPFEPAECEVTGNINTDVYHYFVSVSPSRIASWN